MMSGCAAVVGIYVAKNIHENQKLLAQRQLLLPLWEYMANLSEVDYINPITPDVIKVVNSLELVALCCEAGIVDPGVIRRTFKEQYVKHYENVERCGTLPGCAYDGRAILRQNRAAMQFYESLNNERLSEDRLGRV